MKRFVEFGIVGLVCLAAIAGTGWYLRETIAPSKAAAPRTGEPGHAEDRHDDGVTLSDAQVAAAGIELLTAGPRTLQQALRLDGLVQPNQETMVKVTPRFPGVIRSMRKRLGDTVRKDEVLATVESNQSLTIFELKAPMDGTVIDRDGTLGEFASEQKPLFTIADLSTMWVDFAVHRNDFTRVHLGDAVMLDIGDDGDPVHARIDYISPIGVADTQSGMARTTVANGGRLKAGLFVTGKLALSAQPVDIAVSAAAIQTLEGKTVVFVRDGQIFGVREVELGRRDAGWVEVRFGLLPGDVYAAANSFVVKAEIGKGSAAHEH